MIKGYLVIFVCFQIFVCGCNTKTDTGDTIDIVSEEKLIFQIDSVTIRSKVKMGYVEKFKSIYLFNPNSNKIDFYRLENQELWSSVTFNDLRLSNIHNIDLLKIISLDSIYIYSSRDNSLSLFSDQGKTMVSQIEVLPKFEDEPFININTKLGLLNKSELIFSLMMNESVTEDKISPFLFFSPNENRLKYFGTWPKSYMNDKSKYRSNVFLTEASDNFFVSFKYSDEVFLFDSLGVLIETIYGGSNRMPSYKPYSGDEGDLENMIRHMKSTSSYQNILFDKSSGYILREATIGLDIPKSANALSNEKFPSINGDNIYAIIIVIDPKIGKLGEIHHRRLYFDAFSTEDALYLRDNLFKKENEDIFVLSRIKLK